MNVNPSMHTFALQAGGKWSGRIAAGKTVQFTAQSTGANLALLLYNADDLTERYNMPDTLKAQYTSHLTKGHVLMSDQGRVLASIIEDSIGWHDPLGGYTTRAITDEKYNPSTYQQAHNAWLRSGQENLVVELVRQGMSKRDLVSVVNLFSKVVCDDTGALQFSLGHCAAGESVTLRMDMNVLMVLSNTPHPLNPQSAYPSGMITVAVTDAEPADTRDDVCVSFREENRRAFENTWVYHTLRHAKGERLWG